MEKQLLRLVQYQYAYIGTMGTKYFASEWDVGQNVVV